MRQNKGDIWGRWLYVSDLTVTKEYKGKQPVTDHWVLLWLFVTVEKIKNIL